MGLWMGDYFRGSSEAALGGPGKEYGKGNKRKYVILWEFGRDIR